jgi:ABC-type multidrug transport system ATPase subunit
MKLLAQQMDLGSRYLGTFKFDGVPPDKQIHHRKVAYVTQEDIHIAALTV